MEEDLQQKTGNPEARIIDHFDLFAGTSAGAILIALYLTPSKSNPNKPKFTAKEVLEIYLRDGCKSFATANPDLSKVRKEKYCSISLERQLQKLLGAKTNLQQLLKPAFFTAYDMENEVPVYLESWEKSACKVWQVVRASAAAPGLFGPAIVDNYDQTKPLIDGSIFASNPAMCAYALAKKASFNKFINNKTSSHDQKIKEMILVSLGTGQAPKTNNTKNSSWIRIMMKNLMTSGSILVDQQLQQLFLGSNQGTYFRFNPQLNTSECNIDMVESKYLNYLCKVSKDLLKQQTIKISEMMNVIC